MQNGSVGLTKISLEVDRQDDTNTEYDYHTHVIDEVTLEGEILDRITSALLKDVLISGQRHKDQMLVLGYSNPDA